MISYASSSTRSTRFCRRRNRMRYNSNRHAVGREVLRTFPGRLQQFLDVGRLEKSQRARRRRAPAGSAGIKRSKAREQLHRRAEYPRGMVAAWSASEAICHCASQGSMCRGRARAQRRQRAPRTKDATWPRPSAAAPAPDRAAAPRRAAPHAPSRSARFARCASSACARSRLERSAAARQASCVTASSARARP